MATATKKKTVKNAADTISRVPHDVPDMNEDEIMVRGDLMNLQPIVFEWMQIELNGTSPLITNKFSEEALKAIEDKQTGGATGKKLQKPPRVPPQEWMNASHICEGRHHPDYADKNIYGIPAVALKKAMATGMYRYGDASNKVFTMGACSIHGPYRGLMRIENPDGSDCIPEMGRDMVVLQGGKPVASLAYRPYFFPWKITVLVRYCASLITKEALIHGLYIAGNCIGIGSWRTEKGGGMGCYDLGEMKSLGKDFKPPMFKTTVLNKKGEKIFG
jgi:hypothetical protein